MPRGTDPITKRYRYAFDSAATLDKAERKRDELIERLAEAGQPDARAQAAALPRRIAPLATLHAIRVRAEPRRPRGQAILWALLWALPCGAQACEYRC